MVKDKYSAGMVSKPFWFIEFKKVMQLLDGGSSYEEIKRKSIEENLFGVPKIYRAKEIYNAVARRAKSLERETIKLFCSTDLSSSKALALLAVMKTDRLFFEFMYEVYREKIILGTETLKESDINIYFKNKQSQSEGVASWEDCTLKKLANSYLNVLSDSGFILREGNINKITPPILDIAVEQHLTELGMENYLQAIMGDR
jgi:hypothetical protein